MPKERDQKIELPNKAQFEEVHPPHVIEQESISSKDHRRFYQAPIDPIDNQS